MSGVLPSRRVMTGVFSLTGRYARYRWMTPWYIIGCSDCKTGVYTRAWTR